MGIIKTSKLIFDYIRRDEEENIEEVNRAIDDVSIEIKEGEFVAVLGHNGSGKSTFAKQLDAILLPTDGTVWIQGLDTSKEENLWEVRKKTGMVFQNPDNQIIGNIVEEDVGFGPENMGIPTDEIWKRVDESLEAVGMTAYRMKSPNKLSGGQKQRVAIAGVMAMRPQCIVLDEPTAMLDPIGRAEVMKTIRELNRSSGVTVVLITHHMDEAAQADRLVVMAKGRVVADGTPRKVFQRVEELKAVGLTVPETTELLWQLRQAGVDVPLDALSDEECAQALFDLLQTRA